MPRMIDELINQGFKLRSYNVGNHKTTCPRCSSSRTNKSDPCMSVTIMENDSAVYNCHHCGWSGSAGAVHVGVIDKPKEYTKPELPKGAIGSMPEVAATFLTGRKINRAAWERNKLFYDEKTGSLCFPFIYEGQIINVKSRKIAEKRFSLSKGSQLIFYGLDDLKGQDTAIIVEGEMDKLALEVCGYTNVISVPNGAPAKIREGREIENTGIFEYLSHAQEILQSLKKIIIAVDNDPAGKVLEFELARRLGKEKCFLVEWPCKDANDVLIKYEIDIVRGYIESAAPHPIHGLYSVLDFSKSLTDYFIHGMQRGVATGWNNLDILYSVPLKRFTVITGISNTGKSEWLDCLIWNLAKQSDWRFVIFSPENGKEMHVAKLAEKIIEKPIDPKSPSRMTLNEFSQGSLVVHKYFSFIVSEDFQTLATVDWILDKARVAILRYGIKGIVIDPYNEIHRDSNEPEKDFISKMLSKFRKFVNTYDVHLWIIAHPTKMQKDKDGKLLVPSLQDISGAAEWHSKPDFGIVIHRSEGISEVTEVHVKKVRFKHEGRKGVCNLLYNKNTGTYSEPNKSKASFADYDEPDEISFDA
jgi:twinkle protein